MSYNQVRSDKNNDSAFFKKSGRSVSFNQQRSSSGFHSKPGGAGVCAPSGSRTSNRSSKKFNNAQGGQYRAAVSNINSSAAGTASTGSVQTGANVLPQSHGKSDAPVSSTAAKPTENSTVHRSPRAVPEASTSQPASMSSDTVAPATPAKDPEGPTEPLPLQFGSISPGLVNGMLIPPRTTSAPPNLDEQKSDQSSHRPQPEFTATVAPRQPFGRNDACTSDQPQHAEAHPPLATKKNPKISSGAPQTQKLSASPAAGVSMVMPFQQPKVSVPFGGPNQHMQSQVMTVSSFQMPLPIPLPMGSTPQVQQQIFVPGLQSHQMQPQGIVHQGQSLGFPPQISSPLTPQLSNFTVNFASQYPQQQGGNFGSPRKPAVRITDPKTNEELRFDNKPTDACTDTVLSAPMSPPNAPPLCQPNPSFAVSHTINYYPRSYSSCPVFFPHPSSLTLTGGQIGSNSQRQQPNHPQNIATVNPPDLNSLPVKKAGNPMDVAVDAPNLEKGSDINNLSTVSLPTVHMTVRPPADLARESITDLLPVTSPSVEDKSSSPAAYFSLSSRGSTISTENSFDSSQAGSGCESLSSKSMTVTTEESTGFPGAPASDASEVVCNNSEGRTQILSTLNSVGDIQNKVDEEEHMQPKHQISGDSASLSLVSEDHGTRTTPAGMSDMRIGFEIPGTICGAKPDLPVLDKHLKLELVGNKEQGDKISKGSKDADNSEIVSETVSAVSVNSNAGAEKEHFHNLASVVNKVLNLADAQSSLNESVIFHAEAHLKPDNFGIPSETLNSVDFVMKASNDGSSSGGSDNSGNNGDVRSGRRNQFSATVHGSELSKGKFEGEIMDNIGNGAGSQSASGSRDKPSIEMKRASVAAARGKKKRKEILQRADAAGLTSDLYMAYKGPQEKKELTISTAILETTSVITDAADLLTDASKGNLVSEKDTLSYSETDDWEDVADISPELDSSNSVDHHNGVLRHEEETGSVSRKYSRDFLIKFADQFTELPKGFEMTPEVEALISIGASHSRDRGSHPTPRRMNRQSSGSRGDRRGSGFIDDGKWNKMAGPVSGQDPRLDIAYGGNSGLRAGQGANFGVLRNPRTQSPVQIAGGILSGPMQSTGFQGGMQRYSLDADRWQKATNLQQKGLIPPPVTPLQVMHKAEKKYEVGKVSDVEEAKQRQLKAILNKLTPQNFEKLFQQVKAVEIDSAKTLTGVINQIFDKALTEPTFCEMYANFCFHLSGKLPDFSEDNEKVTFKRLLLNKCQEEFERGEREQEEANKVDEEGEMKQSEEEREGKRIKARRRMLGNIRLIGELYKKRMLTERIMHECIKKLLGQHQNPDEEDVEALCKLMSTIGEMIDHPKAKEHMDAYFDMMTKLSNNIKLSSRVRFMLKDVMDLRKNRWQQRRKVEGPKKIDEVHRDAAQERQAIANRLGRAQSMNQSSRRGAPMDFGSRSSAMLPSNSPIGNSRGFLNQVRGYGNQDGRLGDKQTFEPRTLLVATQNRGSSDESVSVCPQSSLDGGMSLRGPQSIVASPVANISVNPGNSRRMTAGFNGDSSTQGQSTYSSRDCTNTNHRFGRLSGSASFRQMSAQERGIFSSDGDTQTSYSNDRSLVSTPATQATGSGMVLPEDRLRDMAMTAIREFYSARDEKEVALCIKDLNSPLFLSSMIHLWITDSFERKDVERDLLARLLVNLTKSDDGTLSQAQLNKGIESVLGSLEDAVTDAPKAPVFMGVLLAKFIQEDLTSLEEVGQLLYEGGEEPGSLREAGLSAEVLGNTLESIRSQKGESFLTEVRRSSNLRLETFLPPGQTKSMMLLEKFI